MWSNAKPRSSETGFSLVEVLVATALTGVVLTAIASVMSLSIKNAAQAGYRSRATDIAQDAIEFFRREQALNSWSAFTAPFAVGTTTYCLKNLPSAGQIGQLAPGGCGSQGSDQLEVGNGVFLREAEVIKDLSTPDQLEVKIVVTWEDSQRTSEVEVSRIFKKP